MWDFLRQSYDCAGRQQPGKLFRAMPAARQTFWAVKRMTMRGPAREGFCHEARTTASYLPASFGPRDLYADHLPATVPPHEVAGEQVGRAGVLPAPVPHHQ